MDSDAKITFQEPLMDSGLDSLAAVEFRNRLSNELQGVVVGVVGFRMLRVGGSTWRMMMMEKIPMLTILGNLA